MMKFKSAALATCVAALFCTSAPAHAQAGTQFIGQIAPFGANYCPRGWAATEGQLLPISSNTALFAIIGTIYGGDGRSTMGLPDLRGRRPIGPGTGAGIGTYRLGEKGGTTQFVLNNTQLPAHSHTGRVRATNAPADTNNPVRNDFAVAPAGTNVYADNTAPNNNMAANSVQTDPTGGNQAVNKVSPYQAVRWCIATVGIFPSRN